ncbi:DUF4148 domain-containing protein [Paraburkholderia sp. DHOC27]|uniref:DUF4148 domain-containing protein n=1 Tax=Paraburkholderia sp. DHOC27 TaxID=2303330 RepID=UPI000E3CF36A|nr:DUF4148 domain-containing protein [Paraburkholderia sp. DHOC27]RFU48386.1 DUF4148 domain-containing protein [Paraburkholderia sp. DHOC27]
MNTKFVLALSTILIASAAAVTSASAQEVTRAQVRADLIRVEQAGYNPSSGADPAYPADIQAAEAKIAAQDNMNRDAVGGTPLNGSSAAGGRVHSAAQSTCVGPVSFCNIYAGG